MKQPMEKSDEGRKLFTGKMNKMDDRGSAIVIVIIAMALVGILATTILWASYLNYRIKLNDLKVKNSFYSAETVVEQIVAGVKKNVSEAINEAYQEVVNNWDALGTEANRESYFVTAYIKAVENKFITPMCAAGQYDKNILRNFVDDDWWNEGNPEGYIVNKAWNDAIPEFRAANAVNGYGSMSLKNICVEFYDSDGYLSIINTDIAIDVPKLRFTQAGTIDRLYPYVLIGDEGIELDANTVTVSGSIYGGVDDEMQGGIRIAENSHVTIEDAAYVISGGDIVIGNSPIFTRMVNQNASLIIRDEVQSGTRFLTGVYADGLALNGSRLDISGRMYIANDLVLSGKGSDVSLAGQYYGYGNTNETMMQDANPADTSSAIVINGKNSTVDLTELTVLQLAGRAYVGLSRDDGNDNGMPHVLMGESISVKSNQIAYLVPAECVGTLNGSPVIGQNPVSFETWAEMLNSLSEYQTADADDDFRIVDAGRETVKLGGGRLCDYGIPDIKAGDLNGVDVGNPVEVITALNQMAVSHGSGIRFLYQADKEQVYLYLIMDKDNAAKYFTQYYNVNSNKASLDNYFNQYVSGGIRLKGNAQGYMVVGNSMVSDNAETIISENELEDPEEIKRKYENLTKNLLEDDPGVKDNVFENLVRLTTDPSDPEEVQGLQDYLDSNHGKVEFTTGEGADTLKAVLVDSKKQPGDVYKVSDSGLRLVIAIGDVEITGNFQGLIIASGKITVSNNATIQKDGEGVYAVLRAKSEVADDANVPANILCNGEGMIRNGYDDTDVDDAGNLNIDYSKIVRYENWIKK